MGFSRQEYWSGVPLPSPSIFFGWLLNRYLWKHSLQQRQSMSLQNVRKPQASIKNHLSVLVSQGKESGCQWRKIRRCEFSPWVGVWKMPWRRKWQPTSVFLQLNRHIVFLSFTYFSSLSLSLSLSLPLYSFFPLPFFFSPFLSSFFFHLSSVLDFNGVHRVKTKIVLNIFRYSGT